MSATDKGDNQPVNIPLFLKKLWKMVNDKDNQDIIGWNSTGDGFVIHDPVQFIMKLLPHYFKHNNLASFVRQLNFYDFHKIASPEKDEMQFAHHYFLKDLPETLVFITRKVPNLKPRFSKEVNEEDMKNILNGMKEIKSKHNLVDKELKLLKQENNTLWHEMNNLRVKYSKQTKIINKLIHFLISYIHQNQYGKRTTNIIKKNNPRNIHSRPSLLEIGYQPSQLEGVAEHLKYLQPGSSGALTYDVDYLDDNIQEQLNTAEALDNILNIKSEDIEDDSIYSVQFPNSPNRVVEDTTVDEDNLVPMEEVVDDQQTDICTQEQTVSPEIIPQKLVQITRNNTLEDVYQIKDATSNSITYSIKYPKMEVVPKKRVAASALTQSEVDPKKLKMPNIISLPSLRPAKQIREKRIGVGSRSSLSKLNRMELPRKQAALLADLVSTSGIKRVPTTTSLDLEQVATSISSPEMAPSIRRGSISQQNKKAGQDLHLVSKPIAHIKSQLQRGSNNTTRQEIPQIDTSKQLGKQAAKPRMIAASAPQIRSRANVDQAPPIVSQIHLENSQPVSIQRKRQSAMKQVKNDPQLFTSQTDDKSSLEDQNSVACSYPEQVASGLQLAKNLPARVKTTQQSGVPAKKVAAKTTQLPVVSSKRIKKNIDKHKHVQLQNSEASGLEKGADSSSSTSAIAGSSSEATLSELLLDPDVFSDLPTMPPTQLNDAKLNILENPKEHLTQYVDSTQSELDSLYDVLGTLSSKEWESILSEMTPLSDDNAATALDDICDVVIEEEKDHLQDDNVDTIKHELEEELENMPAAPDEDEDAEVLVDAYLNTDFTHSEIEAE